MARKASPWFWQARSGWYITKNNPHYLLGKHPEDASPPRKRYGMPSIKADEADGAASRDGTETAAPCRTHRC